MDSSTNFLAAVVFFLFALICGAVIQWLVSLFKGYKPPTSILWFTFGMITCMIEILVVKNHPDGSNTNEGHVDINPKHPLGLLGIGIAEAARVNSNVLYYLLLPILLYDATQQISWHYFKKTMKPGIALAIVGVIAQIFFIGVLFNYTLLQPELDLLSSSASANTRLLAAAVEQHSQPFHHLSIDYLIPNVSSPAWSSGSFEVNEFASRQLQADAVSNTEFDTTDIRKQLRSSTRTNPLAFSFVVAAAVASTDPIAAMSVLEAMEAPAEFSSVFEVESMINDGSSIFLFQFFQGMARGETATVGHSIQRFVTLLFVGPIFGYLVAIITYRWVKHFRWYKYDKTLAVVFGSYLAFLVAEIYLETSGPLTIVVYGLYFKAYAKAAFEAEALDVHHHFVRALGIGATAVVFVLCGVASFRMMWDAFSGTSSLGLPEDLPDVQEQAAVYRPIHGTVRAVSTGNNHLIIRMQLLHIVIFYLYLLVARFLMIGAFSPLLKRWLSNYTWKEFILMWWGGLRGGVCLLIALILEQDKSIDPLLSSTAALYIASSAFIILVINGLSFDFLYKWLRPYKPNAFRQVYLKKVMKLIDREYLSEVSSLQQHWLFEGSSALIYADRLVPRLGQMTMDKWGMIHLPETKARRVLQEMTYRELSLSIPRPAADVLQSSSTSQPPPPVEALPGIFAMPHGHLVTSPLLPLNAAASIPNIDSSGTVEPGTLQLPPFDARLATHKNSYVGMVPQNLDPQVERIAGVYRSQSFAGTEPIVPSPVAAAVTLSEAGHTTAAILSRMRRGYDAMLDIESSLRVLEQPESEDEAPDHHRKAEGGEFASHHVSRARNFPVRKPSNANSATSNLSSEPIPSTSESVTTHDDTRIPIFESNSKKSDTHKAATVEPISPPGVTTTPPPTTVWPSAPPSDSQHPAAIPLQSGNVAHVPRRDMRPRRLSQDSTDYTSLSPLSRANPLTNQAIDSATDIHGHAEPERERFHFYGDDPVALITPDHLTRPRAPGQSQAAFPKSSNVASTPRMPRSRLGHRDTLTRKIGDGAANPAVQVDARKYSAKMEAPNRPDAMVPLREVDDIVCGSSAGGVESVHPADRDGEIIIMAVNAMRQLYSRMYQQAFISGTVFIGFMSTADLVTDFALMEIRKRSKVKAWKDIFSQINDHSERRQSRIERKVAAPLHEGADLEESMKKSLTEFTQKDTATLDELPSFGSISWFTSQRRRQKDILANSNGFELEWCVISMRFRAITRSRLLTLYNRFMGGCCPRRPRSPFDVGDPDDSPGVAKTVRRKIWVKIQGFVSALGPRLTFSALDDLQMGCAFVDVHQELLIRGDIGLRTMLGPKMLECYERQMRKAKLTVYKLTEAYPDTFGYAMLCHAATFLLNLKIEITEQQYERGLLLAEDRDKIVEALREQLVSITKFHPPYTLT